MASIRPMMLDDLLHFNAVNLDVFTETFNMNFYFNYLTRWPECCAVAEADGSIAGYIIGKVEGAGANWHGHVSAISVAPEFRRTGVANRLMEYLEEVSEEMHDCYFVDLFVRPTNTAAIKFYEGLGYVIYRHSDQQAPLFCTHIREREIEQTCRCKETVVRKTGVGETAKQHPQAKQPDQSREAWQLSRKTQ
ncbi:N-terminal acetyltransferase B complex catalytic subunit NAA20 (NatB N-alpha-terminal acetylation complex catalytic subunit) [Durusdinium trenchii]|uniref:N-terminal acetyltransferase B complex catalytic subunit NAA20 (NatB N-alpha-terminal acetylation complex catalytic subunit) n=1 Tax=Durusdinium trenchii TaxID=1381693 RepID=A0ABP0Q307_9DINO